MYVKIVIVVGWLELWGKLMVWKSRLEITLGLVAAFSQFAESTYTGYVC